MSPEHVSPAGGRPARLNDPLSLRQVLDVVGGAGLSPTVEERIVRVAHR